MLYFWRRWKTVNLFFVIVLIRLFFTSGIQEGRYDVLIRYTIYGTIYVLVGLVPYLPFVLTYRYVIPETGPMERAVFEAPVNIRISLSGSG